MSNYRELSAAGCAWCHGVGYYRFEDGTAYSEAIFKCLTCGQDYCAEGDYCEHETVTGGYGVLLVKINDQFAGLNYAEDCPYKGRFLNSPHETGLFQAIQLTGDLIENQSLVERLVPFCDWILCVAYDRDRATTSESCKHELWKLPLWIEPLTGTPPDHDSIMAVMLAGIDSRDSIEKLIR